MKKCISLLLCVLLAFSACTTAFAVDYTAAKCTCGRTPVVYITGFGMTDLVANPGTDEAYNVFMPEMSRITDTLKTLIVPLVCVVLFHNYKSFGHNVANAVNRIFMEIACDDDGNPLYPNVDIKYRNPPTSYHGGYTTGTFRYDWREDVFDIAEELNDYIEEVKRLTRHDKIALKAESMGGAVLMTYLKVYGHDSVDTVIMQSSAFNGISLVGDLFNGDLDVQGSNAIGYIAAFLEGNENETNFYRLALRKLGPYIVGPVAKILDKTFEKIKPQLFAESLCDLFGNIPGLWTFVPRERYESAKAYLLDNEKNAVLIQKIDAYHYGVMNHTQELLDEAMADGVKLAIISNYDKAGVPVGKHARNQSDFLIDTVHTSMGATCAPYGETLGSKYSQAFKDGHNHISCDNVIDASTCVYPEYTWFVKDMMHTWYTGGYYDFTAWIIDHETQPTVHDSERYPQFLLNNHETRTLDPLTPENENTDHMNVNWIELIKTFAAKIKK